MRGPGATLPIDFTSPLTESLVAAFQSGRFRAMPIAGTLVVLPRTTGPAQGLIDPRDGPCGLLTANGCSLSVEERPSQCRALVPRLSWGLSGLSCYDSNAPEGDAGVFYADAWRPHEAEVLAAIREVEAKNEK